MRAVRVTKGKGKATLAQIYEYSQILNSRPDIYTHPVPGHHACPGLLGKHLSLRPHAGYRKVGVAVECLCFSIRAQRSVSGTFSVTGLGPVPANIGDVDLKNKFLPSWKLFNTASQEQCIM